MTTTDQNPERNAEPLDTAGVPAKPAPRDAPSARSAIGQDDMLAKTILLEGESLNRFRDLVRILEEISSPVGPAEDSFIETNWRQMRLVGIEKAGLHRQIPLDPASSAYLAFTSLVRPNRRSN